MESSSFALNLQGFIPMPEESESSFIERSLRTKSTLESIKQYLPIAPDLSTSSLDISSDSLLPFSSNRKLLFMHGAITLIASPQEIVKYLQECSVISEIPLPDQEGLLSCIHLREKNRFYRLYSSEEVVRHEMIHAARHLFNSSRFEEILAFQTSPNPIRRFLGPIFQRPYESYLFMVLLFFFGFFLGTNSYINAVFYPVTLFLLTRLTWNQVLFHRCRKKIIPLLKNPDQSLAFLIRLTDNEIYKFSQWSQNQIQSYIRSEKEDEFRWNLLYETYLTY